MDTPVAKSQQKARIGPAEPMLQLQAEASASGVSPVDSDRGESQIQLKRVSTGVSDIDSLIEGGFLVGKSYLIIGEPGTGKTIFSTQFVLQGLINGEKAVYVAVDDKPADIVEQASSLGWDLVRYIENRQLLILDAAPFFHMRAGLGRDRDIDVVKTVSDLSSYVKRMGASRVVIDPVGPLIASREASNRFRENTRLLVRSFQDSMATTNLVTMYSPTSGMSLEGEESPFAGVVILRLSRRQKGLMRTLLVRKMRGTAFDLVEYKIDIVIQKGLVIGQKVPVVMQRFSEGESLFREWRLQ